MGLSPLRGGDEHARARPRCAMRTLFAAILRVREVQTTRYGLEGIRTRLR